MGNWFSSSDYIKVGPDGQVNNNILSQGSGARYNTEMLILTSIICAIKIFEFVMFLYKKHAQNIKGKHERKLKSGGQIEV